MEDLGALKSLESSELDPSEIATDPRAIGIRWLEEYRRRKGEGEPESFKVKTLDRSGKVCYNVVK